MRSHVTNGAAIFQSPKLYVPAISLPRDPWRDLALAPTERHRKLVVPAQVEYIMDVLDDDRWFGDWPIELCFHDVWTGLSYWPIRRVENWEEVEYCLLRYSSRCFISFRWSDRLRWHVLRVGWWTKDDHLEIIRPPQLGRVDWDVADRLDPIECARKGGVVSKMRRKPDYRGAEKLTDRSDYMWLIANLMLERGCDANEIASVLWNSEMSKDRRRADRTDYHERRHIEGEVRRLMEKKR